MLRDRCKALAVLECILDGGEPYYAYTCAWGDDEAALMNNGSGAGGGPDADTRYGRPRSWPMTERHPERR